MFSNDEAGKLIVTKSIKKGPMTVQYFGSSVIELKPWQLLVIHTDGNTRTVIFTCESDFIALYTGGRVIEAKLMINVADGIYHADSDSQD